MFGLDKKLVDMAIDKAFELVKKKLKEFKDFIGSNDGDKINDVDQLIAKIGVWNTVVKDLLSSVKVDQLMASIDVVVAAYNSMMAGLKSIGDAIDKDKLKAAIEILKEDAKWLASVVKAAALKLRKQAETKPE